MKNKILVKLVVPDIDEFYDVFIPANKKIGNVIILLCKYVTEATNGLYQYDKKINLYDKVSGEKYAINSLVKDTAMRNNSTIILL